MRILLIVLTCTLLIGVFCCVHTYKEIQKNVEETNRQQILLIKKQNTMIQNALNQGIVVVQQFGKWKDDEEKNEGNK